jgi:dTDP-4-amino-4,6-dideoxygalactose transaminase
MRLGTIKGLRVPVPHAYLYHAYCKYYIFVRSEHLLPGWNRDRILQAISAEGVPCFVDSCSDAYRQKAFLRDRRDSSRLPVATALHGSSLVFLVHPALKTENIEYACRVIESVMAAAMTADTTADPSLAAAKGANSSR